MEAVDIYDEFCIKRSDDEVYEKSITNLDSNMKRVKKYRDEFFMHKYINSNKPQKIDDIVKEGDIVEILDCNGWKCKNLLNCRIKDNIVKYKSNKWMDNILAYRESVFKAVVGIEKQHPTSKRKCVSFIL